MEYLPVEILAHIVSFADLVTKQIFRTTCRTLNHYIAQYHFSYQNTAVDQLEAVEQQLAQRTSDQISVDFRNPPLKLRLQAITAIKSISKFVNITSLNILDLTSELSVKHTKDTTCLSALTNLERLAVKSYVLPDNTMSFSRLTKLTLSHISWTFPARVSNLQNLQDLSLVTYCELHNPFTACNTDVLTRLHIEFTNLSASGISLLTNLKQLIVENALKDSYADLGLQSRWTALEHLKLAVHSIPNNIALNINLTRLEIRCHEILYNVNTLSALTNLQLLDLRVQRELSACFTFLEKLPLRSAHLSFATADNTKSIQHFNADTLHHLGLEIDSNSHFKGHLTRLTNLESLTLTSSLLQSVTLTFLTRLTCLMLRQVQCGTVAPFTKLKVLSVVGNQRALGGLNSLTNLEQLDCALKPTELCYLSTLTRLQHLHLIVKGSVQTNVLAGLTQLTYLRVDTYNFPSMSWLTSMTRLNHLDLINTAIKPDNFSLMTALTNLTQLKVNCSEPSTKILFKLTRLQRIQLTPFKEQPMNLKELFIKNLPHFIALKINLAADEDCV